MLHILRQTNISTWCLCSDNERRRADLTIHTMR